MESVSVPLIISILGAVGVWTLSVIGVMLWLTKQFKDTRHTLRGSMDQRFAILDDKIEVEFDKLGKKIKEEFTRLEAKIDKNYELLDSRVKDIELRNARINGVDGLYDRHGKIQNIP
jgi:hypothetical protein